MDNNGVSKPGMNDDELEFVPRRARRQAGELSARADAAAGGNAGSAEGTRPEANSERAPYSSPAPSAKAERAAGLDGDPGLPDGNAPDTGETSQVGARRLKHWYADYLQPKPTAFEQRNTSSVPRAPVVVTPPIDVDADAPRTVTRRTQAVLVPNDPDGDRLKTSRIKVVKPSAAEPTRTLERRDRKKLRAKGHAGQASYEILSWARMLAIVIAVACVLRMFVFELVYVEGTSMNPTLSVGELVFASKLDYRFGAPQRGDIVICRFPNRDGTFIKRIVGMPGETFQLAGGVVYIDGERLDESYTAPSAPDDYGPVRITAGQYIVLGDNRSVSHDSRSDDVGTLSADKFVGRVHAVVYPFNESRLLDDLTPELVPTPKPDGEANAMLAVA